MWAKITIPARENTRFHPRAFDNQIGTTLDVSINNEVRGQGTIVGAEVNEDGTQVLVTLEYTIE